LRRKTPQRREEAAVPDRCPFEPKDPVWFQSDFAEREQARIEALLVEMIDERRPALAEVGDGAQDDVDARRCAQRP